MSDYDDILDTNPTYMQLRLARIERDKLIWRLIASAAIVIGASAFDCPFFGWIALFFVW